MSTTILPFDLPSQFNVISKSQTWERLRFFDKTGSNLNLSLNDSGLLVGNIHLPRVSTNILENQHVFLLEQFFNTNTSSIVWGQPLNKISNTNPSKFKVYFKNSDTKFFVYTVQILEQNPVILKTNEVEILLDTNIWSTTTNSGGKEYKNVTSYTNKALQLNICFSSESEEIIENILCIDFIPDSNSPAEPIAEITFRAETVEEDERFKLNLENFGRTINESDSLIFRDTDINEPKPNWIKINEKRKELLLEGHNIYPYIGAYKGLINAINYFGYQDLTIKEYWLNIDVHAVNYGKITQVEIPKQYTKVNPHQSLIDNTKFKKTQQFGLFYNINEATDEEDEFGFPIVKETFMFTNEEVLVKLFALREKLKAEFLPQNARIIDITGEGVYFEKFKLRSWVDQTLINKIEVGDDHLDFIVEPSISWITDLRPIIHEYTNTPKLVSVDATPNLVVYSINNCVLSYFITIDDLLVGNYLADDLNIPAGAKINLSTDALNIIWNDLDITWNNLEGDTGQLYTWDNVGYGNGYEIEWIIEKKTDQKYFFKIRGSIEQLNNFVHYLPYDGFYDVTLSIYDLFNGVSKKVKNSIVEAASYKADFTTFTRMLDQDNMIWNTINFEYEHLSSTWDLPIQNATAINESNLTFEDLNFANYRFQDFWTWDYYTEQWKFVNDSWDEFKDDLKRFGTNSLIWNNFENNQLNDLWHQTWDFLDYKGDRRGGYLINSITLPPSENPVPGWYYPAIGYFNIPSTGFDSGDEFLIDSTIILEGTDYINGATDEDTASNLCTAINTLVNTVTATHNYSTNQNGVGKITIKAKVTGLGGNSIVISVLNGNAIASGPTLANAGVVPSEIIVGIDKDTEIWIDNVGTGFPFKFSSTINPNDWVQGAIDLNNSTMPGISDFYYVARPLNTPTHIHAVAKFDGQKGNKNFIIRRLVASVANILYYTQNENINTGVIDGSFNYNDLWSWTSDVLVPTCAPLFMSYSRSLIPGKTNAHWRIYDEINNKLISTIKSNYLIWNFDTEGTWSIELELTDSNKNVIKNYKKGIIKTYVKE